MFTDFLLNIRAHHYEVIESSWRVKGFLSANTVRFVCLAPQNSGCWTNNESEFIFRGKIFRDFFSSKLSIFSTFQVIANERNTYVKEHKSRRKKINCIFLIILKNVYYKEMKNPLINWYCNNVIITNFKNKKNL